MPYYLTHEQDDFNKIPELQVCIAEAMLNEYSTACSDYGTSTKRPSENGKTGIDAHTKWKPGRHPHVGQPLRLIECKHFPSKLINIILVREPNKFGGKSQFYSPCLPKSPWQCLNLFPEPQGQR